MILLPTIISVLALNKLALAAAPLHFEPYPEVLQGLELDGYSYNDEIPIECIQRNMDTGEHLFDEHGKYKLFFFSFAFSIGHVQNAFSIKVGWSFCH